MKLELENFQVYSGKHSFEFEPGITIIVGPSSSGKSSLIRALRGLILNYIPSSKAKKYITHFKDHLQIDLQLDDRINFSWYKDNKNTSYRVKDLVSGSEEKFEKCGNEDLESICEKSNLEFPFIIRDKRLLNTHTERDGMPFPFDLSDTELFKVFEELYNVSSSGIIFKYMKSLESKTNSEVKSIKSQIEIDKSKIEKIIDLEDKYDLQDLTNLKIKAEKIQAGMLGIDEDINIARKNNRLCKTIKSFLEDIVVEENTEELLNKGFSLIKESKELIKDIRIIDSNNKIEQITIYKEDFNIDIIKAYISLLSDFNKAKSLNKELKSAQEEINELLKEKEDIEKEIAKIDTCPLCGARIGDDNE